MTDRQAAAAEALAVAEASRAGLVRDLRLPRGHHAATVLFWSLFIAALAIQWPSGDDHSDAARWMAVVMLFVAAGIASWQIRRFKAVNGVSLQALTWRRGRTLKATTAGVVTTLTAVISAIIADGAGDWWLVALLAFVGGSARALVSWWWTRLYRAEQDTRAA